MAVLHNTPRHSRERDYIELRGKKNFQMDWHFIMSRRLYFGLLRNISNIHWKYFNFFTSPFFLNYLLFCKRFDCFNFQNSSFFRTVIRCARFLGEKNFQWGLRSIMPRGPYFGLSRKSSNFIWQDPIHDPRSDPSSDRWSGPWSNLWSDPVRSRFCRRRAPLRKIQNPEEESMN